MKKSIILTLAALIAAASLSACGSNAIKKDVDPNAITQNNSSSHSGQSAADSSTEQSDAADNGQNGSDLINTGESNDIENVEGELLEEMSEAANVVSGNLNGNDVSILDAKKVNKDGTDYIVVEFEYTNRTGNLSSFQGALQSNAYQDGLEIRRGVAMNIEGYDNGLSAVENIEDGQTIRVQQVWVLGDTTTPVEIQVYPFGQVTDDLIKKTFEL